MCENSGDDSGEGGADENEEGYDDDERKKSD